MQLNCLLKTQWWVSTAHPESSVLGRVYNSARKYAWKYTVRRGQSILQRGAAAVPARKSHKMQCQQTFSQLLQLRLPLRLLRHLMRLIRRWRQWQNFGLGADDLISYILKYEHIDAL